MNNTPVEGPVFFTCTACAARYPLHWAMAGKTVHCKACGQIVTVDPDKLVIPAGTPVEAVRQLRDALTTAETLTTAAHNILLQFNHNQEEDERERQEKQQADLAEKKNALTALTGKIRELEAALQEKIVTADRQATDLQVLQAKFEAQEKRSFQLALELKTCEEKLQAVAQKENLLKSLCNSIEVNLKKDIDVHQTLLASLRQQLKFG